MVERLAGFEDSVSDVGIIGVRYELNVIGPWGAIAASPRIAPNVKKSKSREPPALSPCIPA